MLALLGQQAPAPAFFAGWAIWLMVVGAIIAVVLILLRAFGLEPPSAVKQILWVLLLLVIGVIAVKFIMSVL